MGVTRSQAIRRLLDDATGDLKATSKRLTEEEALDLLYERARGGRVSRWSSSSSSPPTSSRTSGERLLLTYDVQAARRQPPLARRGDPQRAAIAGGLEIDHAASSPRSPK